MTTATPSSLEALDGRMWITVAAMHRRNYLGGLVALCDLDGEDE
jgi:hypothetical protein